MLILTCKTQNLNIARAVQVGAAHRAAAGCGGAQQNRQKMMPTGPLATKSNALLALQGIVDNCLESLFASTNCQSVRLTYSARVIQFSVSVWVYACFTFKTTYGADLE